MTCRWCRRGEDALDGLCVKCLLERERRKHPMVYKLFLDWIADHNLRYSNQYNPTYGLWKKYCLEGNV